MMQRVGQRAPRGRIVDVRRGMYEIKWDDGHTSLTTPTGIVRLREPKT